METWEKSLHPFRVLSQKRGERLPQDHHQIVEKECQPQGARARATEFMFPLLCRDVLRSPSFGWIWRDEKQYVWQNPLCAVEEVDEEQKLAFFRAGDQSNYLLRRSFYSPLLKQNPVI